jgi:alpha-L-fucosidase
MGGSWSFNKDDSYKPTRQLIHTLADIVSKGGNLLLNIGPGPDGKWHQQAYDRLQEIGEWMAVNKEAIYNTKGGEKFAEGNIRFTHGKDGKTYAIYLASDGENKMPSEIVISSFLPKEKASVYLLGYKKPLKWKKTGNAVVLSVPKEMQNTPPGKYAWVFSFSTN